MEHPEVLSLRKLVSESGHFIRWSGQSASGTFYVISQSAEGRISREECNPSTWTSLCSREDRLKFKEADKSLKATTDCSPPDETAFSAARRAAVFGVNLGGDCLPGACKRYNAVHSCSTAYDIETLMDKTREGGFALYDSDILSIAAKCSCGDEFYTYAEEGRGSSQMVSEFIRYLLEHAPLWTVGWNCYNFDNECMRFHSSSELKALFLVTRTGAFGKPTYGSIINVPGTYNVDLQLYMVKSLYRLPSFKLGDVAKHMRVTQKMKMPLMNQEVNRTELREYNVNDCVVTLDIWKKEKMEHVIPSIALCTSSPVYDCTRYVTGTLASLGYSSYCMARGHLIEWSTCSSPQSYTGGYVMEPVKGLHDNILVCDFKSMYPTIMASCNINPHSFVSRRALEGERDGHVRVGRYTVEVCVGETVSTFDNRAPSVMSQFMRYMIDERTRHKKSLPMYATSLKVLSNSVYGSLGYGNSRLYSPTCAAAITAVGRHCVKMSRSFFLREGLQVIYGDTDSCMVKGEGSREEVALRADGALQKLHAYMEDTSLSMMRMEVEEHYRKGLMTDKKRYCMKLSDGTIKTVGISLSRKDVSGLCREAARVAVNALFMEERSETLNSISSFVSAVSQLAVQGSLTLSDISRYVKKDGVSCYSYPSVDGQTKYVPEDEASLGSVTVCDTNKVLKSVALEIERFTVPCKLGSVSDIMRASSFWME
jgi:DNA polymerase elongation subunit (family B)